MIQPTFLLFHFQARFKSKILLNISCMYLIFYRDLMNHLHDISPFKFAHFHFTFRHDLIQQNFMKNNLHVSFLSIAI